MKLTAIRRPNRALLLSLVIGAALGSAGTAGAVAMTGSGDVDPCVKVHAASAGVKAEMDGDQATLDKAKSAGRAYGTDYEKAKNDYDNLALPMQEHMIVDNAKCFDPTQVALMKTLLDLRLRAN